MPVFQFFCVSAPGQVLSPDPMPFIHLPRRADKVGNTAEHMQQGQCVSCPCQRVRVCSSSSVTKHVRALRLKSQDCFRTTQDSPKTQKFLRRINTSTKPNSHPTEAKRGHSYLTLLRPLWIAGELLSHAADLSGTLFHNLSEKVPNSPHAQRCKCSGQK